MWVLTNPPFGGRERADPAELSGQIERHRVAIHRAHHEEAQAAGWGALRHGRT